MLTNFGGFYFLRSEKKRIAVGCQLLKNGKIRLYQYKTCFKELYKHNIWHFIRIIIDVDAGRLICEYIRKLETQSQSCYCFGTNIERKPYFFTNSADVGQEVKNCKSKSNKRIGQNRKAIIWKVDK